MGIMFFYSIRVLRRAVLSYSLSLLVREERHINKL